MKGKAGIALLVSLMVALAGCATVEGAGQDISGAARTVGGWFGG